VGEEIKRICGQNVMVQRLAYLMRSGAPDSLDRMVAYSFGNMAYELIARRELDHTRLVAALLEMDGVDEEEPVFRAEGPEFRMWLDRARAGQPVPGEDPSLDAAVRATVLGVAYRRDPKGLVSATTRLGRLFHNDAGTVAAGIMSASAVAASCFAQSGMDLIAGVGETIGEALEDIGTGLVREERIHRLQDEVTAVIPAVGTVTGEGALDVVGGDVQDPIQMVLAGILLAAPVAHRHHLPIEQAARIGGSNLGAIVGAIVGARVGIRAWPWAFANDTWFAEIGRRLVRGPDEVSDLPIPYAVEQHLMSGGRPGFH
jgi:ADP-ribosylglycohydrolase